MCEETGLEGTSAGFCGDTGDPEFDLPSAAEGLDGMPKLGRTLSRGYQVYRIYWECVLLLDLVNHWVDCTILLTFLDPSFTGCGATQGFLLASG